MQGRHPHSHSSEEFEIGISDTKTSDHDRSTQQALKQQTALDKARQKLRGLGSSATDTLEDRRVREGLASSIEEGDAFLRLFNSIPGTPSHLPSTALPPLRRHPPASSRSGVSGTKSQSAQSGVSCPSIRATRQ